MEPGSETMIFSNPDLPEGKTLMRVTKKQPIRGGGERKERIFGTVESGEKEHQVRFVHRYWGSTTEIEMGKDVQDIWGFFKRVGIPTYDALNVAQDGSILVTDVCADGSRIYGNSKLIDIQENKYKPDLTDHPIDLEFIKMTSEKNIGEIEKQATALAGKLSDNLVEMHARDAMELVIHPDGTWKLEILDLREFTRLDSDPVNHNRELNIEIAGKFMSKLKTLREELVKFQKMSLAKRLALVLVQKIK